MELLERLLGLLCQNINNSHHNVKLKAGFKIATGKSNLKSEMKIEVDSDKKYKESISFVASKHALLKRGVVISALNIDLP